MSSVKELFDLSGQVAVVTGGATGIGLQMALGLAEAGANIVVCSRRADVCEAAAAEIEKVGVKALGIGCDVTKADQVESLKDTVLKKFGRVDILFNNAGRAWVAPPEDTPLERWQQVFDLNITAPFLCAQVFGREFIKQKRGKIVNIASIAGLVGRNPAAYNSIAYGASKGALVNFTRDLAVKWAQHNIQVNAICPGFFVTPINEKMYVKNKDNVEREIPLKRTGGPDDLKGIAVLLASAGS
ncbi:MAG: SDR family NAD(P)-dependent oxidoreductase, partial [Burkholderiales bacterium]|nr:SDR family NAD(P)-dependent oxidoreductase [Burkholderiales bacterium]